jgi:hypothetical protein
VDINAIRSLALSAAVASMGVTATVTPVGEVAVETRGIWVEYPNETMPVGHDFQRREPRRIFALPLAGLPGVPARGSRIVTVPFGGTAPRTFQVDGVDRTEADHVRVILSPVAE